MVVYLPLWEDCVNLASGAVAGIYWAYAVGVMGVFWQA